MDVRGSGPIRIGVSACLLGQEVRFDGGHKRNDFLTGTLGDFVEFVAVCPEVDIGLGIPRESLRLVRDDSGAVRMIANKSGADVTDAMSAYAERRAAALERDDLSGYVLKKDSPSCGMERVRIYGRAGMPVRDGRGLFAEALIRRLPDLPVEEEGGLTILICARISSSGSSRTIGCARCSPRATSDGPPARWSPFTPRTS